MTSSLVGSEMCIRDRAKEGKIRPNSRHPRRTGGRLHRCPGEGRPSTPKLQGEIEAAPGDQGLQGRKAGGTENLRVGQMRVGQRRPAGPKAAQSQNQGMVESREK
eukprot:361074-Prorocentrum_lima.AAC.1